MDDPFEEAPEYFLCAISQDVMLDPVCTCIGTTYERKKISSWLENHDTDPATTRVLRSKTLIPNIALRQAIEAWKTKPEGKDRDRFPRHRDRSPRHVPLVSFWDLDWVILAEKELKSEYARFKEVYVIMRQMFHRIQQEWKNLPGWASHIFVILYGLLVSRLRFRILLFGTAAAFLGHGARTLYDRALITRERFQHTLNRIRGRIQRSLEFLHQHRYPFYFFVGVAICYLGKFVLRMCYHWTGLVGTIVFFSWAFISSGNGSNALQLEDKILVWSGYESVLVSFCFRCVMCFFLKILCVCVCVIVRVYVIYYIYIYVYV
ncbi:hypothetical protein AAMO2058_000637500 [Amorphochlora amoebiformis]